MGELHAHFVPFSAHTRMSGVDMDGSCVRKGAVDAVLAHAGVADARTGASVEAERELQQIAEPLRRDEPRLDAAPREQSIRADSGAVREVGHFADLPVADLRQELFDTLDDRPTGVVRGARDLADMHPPVYIVEPADVRERPSSIDSDPQTHLLTSALAFPAAPGGAVGSKGVPYPYAPCAMHTCAA